MKKNPYIDFTNMRIEEKPYKYLVVKDLFVESAWKALLEWFQGTSNFNKFNELGYKNSIFHISKTNIPKEIEEFINIENISFVKRQLEKAFNVKFKDEILISAQKYMSGDGTLIHNDYFEYSVDSFYFTHRFFVYLNTGWERENGGVLGIFEENYIDSLIEEIQPTNNVGVGIEFSKDSWHAVSAINKGVRFAIHFDFKKAEE